MSSGSTGTNYSAIAKFLHWAVAACVIAIIPIAFIMTNIGEGPLQNLLYTLHKSIGVVVLFLMAFRVIYRLIYSPPPLVPAIPPLMRFAARLSHFAFYVLLIILPILGLLGNSAFTGQGLSVLGLFELPPLLPKNDKQAEAIFELHETLGIIAAALVVIHFSAALYHHFVRRDGTLMRMLP